MTVQSWFAHDRFGLFIHWGLYALLARHEWAKQREEIPDVVYDRYFQFFDPDLYDPRLWAEAASGAGMKYFVVTTKHHEGFCLWDTQLTDYKATNTPARRDLIGPMIDAFRKAHRRVGCYHSLIDWHHPDFVIDDILGQGVAYQARFDPQAKGLGEWLRSRYVAIPVDLCDTPEELLP